LHFRTYIFLQVHMVALRLIDHPTDICPNPNISVHLSVHPSSSPTIPVTPFL
jgi:hypothetical protein